MAMASSNDRPAGALRRAAARALAWSRGRWARLASRLGPDAGKAARLAALPLLFGLGLGAGLLLAQWGARLPGAWDLQRERSGGATLQALGLEQDLAGSPEALPASTRGERPAGVSGPARTGTGSEPNSGALSSVLPGRLVWPADGMVVATAGWRRHPDRGDWRYLPGLELAVPSQAPVRAAADGRVASVEAGSEGFTVVIDHGDGWSTVYGRLFRVRVQQGQTLTAGTIVGHGPNLPEAVPALAGVYGVDSAGSAQALAGSPAAVRGVVTFAVYHGTESVDPLAVMPAASFRVADASSPGGAGVEGGGVVPPSGEEAASPAAGP